jgi:hypothetical protein
MLRRATASKARSQPIAKWSTRSLIGPMVERDGGHDQIEALVRKRQALSAGHHELRATAELRARNLDHLRRRIDTGELDGGRKAIAEEPEQGTGSAADVQDGGRLGHGFQRDVGAPCHDSGVELGAPAVLVGMRPAIEALDVAAGRHERRFFRPVSIPGELVRPRRDHTPNQGGTAMKYVLLIHQGETPLPGTDEWAKLSEDEQKAVYADYQAVNQTSGVTPSDLWLESPETATTVRVQDGQTLTTDGPFVSVKEALGGWLVYDADNLDAAIELASRIPAARMGGGVEVRPVKE